MKDTHVLYAVGILAIIGISACFIGYATGTLLKHTPKQITTTSASVATDTTLQQKKGCACCAENMEKFKERIKQMHAHQQREQSEKSLHE